MSDLLLRAVVAAKLRATEAVRRRTADDRGQTAVEYLGIIAVVVAIVVLIANTNLGQTIVDKLRTQISKVAP
ncbi:MULTISPECIES: Flp family type IVb pilin [Streptomyces]|uniref:Flp family type IVb pilin n=2 Tax=Streptomyces TaxID=1883 RepID=A0ABV9IFW5_9ACTN